MSPMPPRPRRFPLAVFGLLLAGPLLAACAGLGGALLCRFADDQLDRDEFAQRLFALGGLTLRSVRG